MKIRPVVLQPTPQPPVVDGLAFILAWSYDRIDQDAVLQKLRSSIVKLIEAGICERAYLGKSRYRENFNILLGGRRAAFALSATPQNLQMAMPSKFTVSCAALSVVTSTTS
jgi:hypothetical protein